MIKAIIFDCFGVLYVDASRHFYQTYVTNYEQLRPQLSDLHRQSDIGYLSQAELNRQVAELTGLEEAFVGENILGIHKRNQALLSHSQTFRPSYQVGMLSNIGMNGMQTYFDAAELTELFDAVVLSSEVGMVKPDPAIFELMAQRLGVRSDECVMIDDVVVNIEGARSAGMQGIVYTSNEQVVRELAVLLKAEAAS